MRHRRRSAALVRPAHVCARHAAMLRHRANPGDALDLWNWRPGEAVPAASPSRGVEMAQSRDVISVPDRNVSAAHRSASRALAAMGWDLLAVEIDASAGRARIDVQRGNRTVMFFVDRLGRTSFERFSTQVRRDAVGRRGDRFYPDTRTLEFRGRDSFKDPREGLREFVAYLAQNGSEHAAALESAVGRLLLGNVKASGRDDP